MSITRISSDARVVFFSFVLERLRLIDASTVTVAETTISSASNCWQLFTDTYVHVVCSILRSRPRAAAASNVS